MTKAVAFIPARSGSKRVKNKNIKLLDGHPLLAYTIQAAIDSRVFNAVICATDDQSYADVARYYGAEVPFLRPMNISGDHSPDIAWVSWILNSLKSQGRDFEIYSILRPTSPFRQSQTIVKAWEIFINDTSASSLRAIEKCKQHPGKMWVIRDNRMLPILPFTDGSTPWHSSQYAVLPEVYSQNASLEIAWSRIVFENNSIAGESIIPFISQGLEGFDINDPEDWWLAEYYLQNKIVELPQINHSPYIIHKEVSYG